MGEERLGSQSGGFINVCHCIGDLAVLVVRKEPNLLRFWRRMGGAALCESDGELDLERMTTCYVRVLRRFQPSCALEPWTEQDIGLRVALKDVEDKQDSDEAMTSYSTEIVLNASVVFT